MPNLVRDILGLVFALGYRSVAAVVGHDFGSPVAGYCALLRPDVFRSVVLMSAPFPGPPAIPAEPAVIGDFALLDPPRKHYTAYFSTPEANRDMLQAESGLHAFLRAYFHVKSADWKQNEPFELRSKTAAELAKMPRYYVMDRDATMPQTVAPEMPSPAQIAGCAWLTEDELNVCAEEFGRTGFQGGLQWYRCRMPKHVAELQTFSGLAVSVPAMFVAGTKDWGVYQSPGALEAMQTTACARFEGTHLVPNAGHWVTQEQPEAVSELLGAFLAASRS